MLGNKVLRSRVEAQVSPHITPKLDEIPWYKETARQEAFFTVGANYGERKLPASGSPRARVSHKRTVCLGRIHLLLMQCNIASKDATRSSTQHSPNVIVAR
jgi:hypothetical protein